MKKYLWVVEANFGEDFHPTVGVGLNKNDGRDKLKEWRRNNPSAKFRLTKYFRGEAK